MAAVPAERVAEVFVEVADTLTTDFDLLDFLHQLTVRTAELSAAAATGLLLTDIHGRLQFVAASQERVRWLELFQIQTDEGPCRDCFRSGERITNTQLGSAAVYWPRFAPEAFNLGFQAVHAFPLRLRGETIGALGVFDTRNATMDPGRMSIVQALADVATIGLLQERTIHRGELLTEQLQGALNSRIVIEQAKGAIAQFHAITVDHAFERLRTYVRAHRLRLTDVARAIVTSPGNSTLLESLQESGGGVDTDQNRA